MGNNKTRIGNNPLDRIKSIIEEKPEGTLKGVVKEEGNVRDTSAQDMIIYEKKDKRIPWLIPVSARNKDSLIKKMADLREWLKEDGQDAVMSDISFTLFVRRSHFAERAVFIAETCEELLELLKKAQGGYDDKNILSGSVYNNKKDYDEAIKQKGDTLLKEISLANGGEEYYSRLIDAAGYYIKGYDLEWENLFSGKNPKCLSMPTYPFSRERYWVLSDAGQKRNEHRSSLGKLHSLIGVNNSDLKEQKFSTLFDGSEYFISDHIIDGYKILPGAVYLEIARAAGYIAAKNEVVSIKDIVWLNPVIFGRKEDVSEEKEISIGLYPVNNYVEYDIWTEADGIKTINAQGKLLLGSNKDGNPNEIIDIPAISSRLENVKGSEECYNHFASSGVSYGKGFKLIKELRTGICEALAYLEMPQHLKGKYSDIKMHPSILDAAFQTVAGLIAEDDTKGEVYFPFAIDEVEIAGAVAGASYAYAVKTPDNERKLSIPKYDIVIADEAGNCLVKIKGFMLRNQSKIKAVAEKSDSHYTGEFIDAEENLPESIEAGDINQRLEAFLKEVLSTEVRLPVSRINAKETFDSFGIDSVMIIGLTRRMEEHFGELPKTLFFEYRTLSELCEYFINNHSEFIKAKFTQTDTRKNRPAIKSKPDDVKENTSRNRFSTRNYTRESSEALKELDIAIVGISGRYPMADDLDEFWENLYEGKDCITEIPSDRWDNSKLYDPDRNKKDRIYTKWGGFINDVDKFDPLFFNISPKEAELMDPQERIFIESVWHAIEDASYTKTSLDKKKIGVFVGVMYAHYQLFGAEESMKGNLISLGGSYASIANRVSYYFNFYGPSMAVDTMCSSSLTAIHLACDSIRKGESEIAVAGGVNVTVHPNKYVLLSQSKFASSDGRCRSFGDGGDGYVPGEGVGAVILKPLSKAVADKDHIYAVIKGSAINHGGRTNGYTVPNPNAQSEVISEALKTAGINPRAISYIEAHGTGTSLGDPIEINGLVKAFGAGTADTGFCAIGSVKSNIGHLESAAGIAGLTKVLLQMKHKKLVPSIHSQTLNTNINFSKTPFAVQRKLEEWNQPVVLDGGTEKVYPRIAGISSFGAGGSNAHLIIEEYHPEENITTHQNREEIVILSARSNESLLAYAKKIIDFIKRKSKSNARLNLSELAYTLKAGREAFAERVAVLAGSLDELLEKLDLFVQGKEEIGKLYRGSEKSANKFFALDGEAGKAYIEAAIRSNELAKLAALWTVGSKIDWDLMYKAEIPRRISVPGYPFSRERYWVPAFDNNTAIAGFEGYSKLHPLVGRNISDLSEQKYVTSLSGKEFFFADHKIVGKMILPGAAIVEMARAAGELAAGGKASELANVVWAAPVIFENDESRKDTIDLHIGIYPASQAVRYEVWTGQSDKARNIHSQGEITFGPANGNNTKPLDIQAVNSRLASMIDGERLYSSFEKRGFDYGKSFRTVNVIRYDKNEALGFVELPFEAEKDMDILKLHPSIIDGAFQVASVLAGNENNNGSIYIPFAFDRLKILKPLSKSLWVYAVKAKEKLPGTIRYDLKIVDGDGDVLILIEGFTVKAVKNKEQTSYKTVMYTNAWEQESLNSNSTQVQGGKFIVFLKGNGFEEPLVEALGGQDVLFVRSSDCFIENGNSFGINPSSYDDYMKLVDRLAGMEAPNLNILHIWSEPVVSNESVRMNETIDTGINSLLLLTKALFEKRVRGRVRLLYAYAYENEAALPQYASVGAFAKTVGIENPSYIYKTVGIPLDFWNSPEKYLKNIIGEFGIESGGSTEIRISAHNRSVRKMAECAEAANNRELVLKPGGVYIITGGAGGIGLAFAEYISSRQKSIIVLTGRSELTSDKERSLEKIRESGSEVHYIKSDISDMEDVESLTSEVRRKFKCINGVIHSAGVLRDSFILKKDLKDFTEVLAPKLFGSFWLDQATREDRLDFFVLFSSVSAVMGNAGQCDYAYANSFMDYFAAQRESMVQNGSRFGRSVSIAWPLWKEGGMRVSPETESYMLDKAGIVPLDKESGFKVFEYALNSLLPQIMAFKGKAAVIGEFFGSQLKKSIEKANHVVKTDEVIASDIDKSKVSELLRKIVSKEIKLSPEKISETEPLEKYGIDSVMVLNMTRALEEVFANLPKTLFFEYQSIKELSTYFINHHKNKLMKEMGLELKKEAAYDIKPDTLPESDNILRSFKNTRFAALEASNHSVHEYKTEDIAIIGVSGRYPMAKDLNEFWENLKAGRDCITEIPKNRWDYRKYFSQNKDEASSMYSKWGGFIDDVDKFDTLFFNISPREAKMMDPQERLFLQTVWHTMEDAGYVREKLWNKNIGVFVGVMYGQYQLFGNENVDIIPSSNYASIANRVSFFFNFHGPSIAIDTMCSSSLTSIHLACESIKRGESDCAIAGGVNVTIHPNKYLLLSQGKFTSSDGRCRSFGEGGDGYVPGEGVGAVMLKPVSKAIEDGDRIYAVIKSSVINHGGKTNGYTVPNPNAQSELIYEALKKAKIDPKNISYIEAHGTGTSLGDPIEIAGLGKAFRLLDAGTGYCSIGSVKSNIGHLESAAGIAGLTKILLQIRHKKLVPSIHSDILNSNIDFENSPFYVQRELKDWNPQIVDENGVRRILPRIAGISSFGAGGSNAHVILEEYIEESNKLSIQPDNQELILLSAKNTERLKAYIKDFIKFFGKKETVTSKTGSKVDIVKNINLELVKMVSDILDVDTGHITINDNLEELGFDAVKYSLLSERINLAFEAKPLKDILIGNVTIEELSQKLYRENTEYFENRFSQEIKDLVTIERAPIGEELLLSDVAFTLQVGREAMDERLAVIADSKNELIDKLQKFLENEANDQEVYYGNIKKDQKRLRLFDEDDDLQEIIKNWIRKGKLSKLAELWVNGISIDWELLYERKQRRKVSLPLYSFAKDRCWVSGLSENKNTSNDCIHPLLDCIDTGMSFSTDGIVFRKKLRDTELIVLDHKVLDQPIIPGVGYLEMAYASATQIKCDSGIKISNVVLMQPVSAHDGAIDVFVKLSGSKNAVKFEVQTENSKNYNTHVKGEISFENEKSPDSYYSIKDIKGRCTGKLPKEEIYPTLYGMGITYGQYYQTLDEIYWNGKEALGVISLPELYEDELSRYTLHPTIMDASLQTVIGLAMGLNITAPMLPYAIDEVHVLKPLKHNMYSYVTVLGKDRFNIKLLDEQGCVCVELNDVVVRELKNSFDEFFYTPVWKRESINFEIKEAKAINKQKVLIVCNSDDAGLVKEISGRHSHSEVVEMVLGDNTGKISDTRWNVLKDDIDEYEKVIGNIGNIDMVYFLGGIQDFGEEADVLNILDESQERGVLSLFRLIKALSSNGYGPKNIIFKIVTRNAVKVLSNDRIQPLGASIFGLTKTMAKEYVNWEVCCVDVDLDGLNENNSMGCMADAIIAEPANQRGDEVAIRDGFRYIKDIKRVNIPAPKEQPFRKNGVYLILGGAGGIGLEISRYLAESVQANIVLIGRSELKAETAKKIQEIEAKGGKVLYIKADAADINSMEAAVKRAKEVFGSINGAIHSAIVLKDKTLERMDEETFRLVLDPKVKGSVTLYKVLEKENLDFLMFFSSMQSFSGNAGQGNYAAGCTFKDAFAQYIRQADRYPVKIINWGYWGSTGIVASEEYNKRMAVTGIGSIKPAEGIEAVRRILGCRINQVIALKAEKQVLKMFGVDLQNQLKEYPEKEFELGKKLFQTPEISVDLNDIKASKDAFCELEELGLQMLLKMFNDTGIFAGKVNVYGFDEIKKELGITSKFYRLFEELVYILERNGYLLTDNGRIAPTEKYNNFEFEKMQLVSKYPQTQSHFRLLQICTENLLAIMKGEASATETIFPNSSMDLVQDIYKGNVIADYYNALVASSLLTYIENAKEYLSNGKKIRILEVGAGTGGTSAVVFDVINRYGHILSYDYTDISQGFLQHGRKHYYARNPYLQFKMLNIEADIVEQGYKPGEYDVIIASNVLHATRNVRNTMRNIKYLLKTGGLVLINEATEKSNFTTLVFGLLDGWWLYEDREERLKYAPLLNAGMWERLLSEEGFEVVSTMGNSGGVFGGTGQNVFVAQSDGIVIERINKLPHTKNDADKKVTKTEAAPNNSRESRQREASSSVASARQFASTSEKRVSSKNNSPLTDELISQHIKETVIGCVKNILEVNSGNIEMERQFSEYGVDSVTGVELINKINKELGIVLKTTALFDYPNIKALTDFIAKKHASSIRESMKIEDSRIDNDDMHSNNNASEYSIDLFERLAEGKISAEEVYKLMEEYNDGNKK